MDLESEFKNFYIQEGESIENMFSRLMHILNEFDEVRQSLSNSKIVGKIFRTMMRRPRWKNMISILVAIQGTLSKFTHEEVFTHLLALRRSYDKMESSHQSSKKPHFKHKYLHRVTIRAKYHLTHLL
jgi:hypothetical protein